LFQNIKSKVIVYAMLAKYSKTVRGLFIAPILFTQYFLFDREACSEINTYIIKKIFIIVFYSTFEETLPRACGRGPRSAR
jgi:hypothetical protein